MSGSYLKLPKWAKLAVKRHPYVVGLAAAPAVTELAAGTLAALISVGLLSLLVSSTKYLPSLKRIQGQPRTTFNDTMLQARIIPSLYKKAA